VTRRGHAGERVGWTDDMLIDTIIWLYMTALYFLSIKW
jgi:hypothetical protein